MTENMLTLPADNATVKAIVAQVKSDMRGAGKYAAYVAEFEVTRETVKDHAVAIARLVYPNDEEVQTRKDADGTKVRTRFGNAVQAAGNGLRAALGKDDEQKTTDWLRLVKQAAENAANKGGFSAEAIMAAVAETLTAEEQTAA